MTTAATLWSAGATGAGYAAGAKADAPRIARPFARAPARATFVTLAIALGVALPAAPAAASNGGSVATAAVLAGCTFICSSGRDDAQGPGSATAFAQAVDENGVAAVRSRAYATVDAPEAHVKLFADATGAYFSGSWARGTLQQVVEFYCLPDLSTGRCEASFASFELPVRARIDGLLVGRASASFVMRLDPLDGYGNPVAIERRVSVNDDRRSFDISVDDRVRLQASSGVSTQYRLFLDASVNAMHIQAGETVESFADLGSTLTVRFDLPPGLGVRGPGGFYSGVSAVPEPGTWAMLSAGLLAVAGLSRRRCGLPYRP